MRSPYEVILTSDSSSDSHSAAAWDPTTGSLLSTYKHSGGALAPRSLQLLADSYLLAASATKPSLHLWPLNSQTPVPNLRLATPGRASALACSPDGAYICAAVAEKIYTWQSCNGRLLAAFARHYQTVTCLVFNRDGSSLASGGEDGLVFVWSLSQIVNSGEAKPRWHFSHHSLPVKDLYFGRCAGLGRLCSASLDRSARLYDVHRGELLLTLIFDSPLTSVSMDILENDLFVGTSTGVAIRCSLRQPVRGVERHVDTRDDDKVVMYKGHEAAVTALAVSVDCVTLLTGSADKMVHLWDIASCQILRSLKHKAAVVAALFAQAYDNFDGGVLRPSLAVKALQKVSKLDDLEAVVEVCRRDEDEAWLVELDGGGDEEGDDDASGGRLGEAMAEIERLERVNAGLRSNCGVEVSTGEDDDDEEEEEEDDES